MAPAILAELARRDGWVHSAEIVHPRRWEVAEALSALVHRGYVERQRVDVPIHPAEGGCVGVMNPCVSALAYTGGRHIA